MLAAYRRFPRRWSASVTVAVFAFGMVVAGRSVERVGLVFVMVAVLLFGVLARRGFVLRASEPRASTLPWRLMWFVAIAVLITCEVWEFADRSTTVTSLVVPFIAIPVVRAFALAIWARLGWGLLS